MHLVAEAKPDLACKQSENHAIELNGGDDLHNDPLTRSREQGLLHATFLPRACSTQPVARSGAGDCKCLAASTGAVVSHGKVSAAAIGAQNVIDFRTSVLNSSTHLPRPS